MLGPLPLVNTAFDYNLVLHATCSGSSHNNEASPFSKNDILLRVHAGFFPGGGYKYVQSAHVGISVPTRVLMRFWMYSIPYIVGLEAIMTS